MKGEGLGRCVGELHIMGCRGCHYVGYLDRPFDVCCPLVCAREKSKDLDINPPKKLTDTARGGTLNFIFLKYKEAFLWS